MEDLQITCPNNLNILNWDRSDSDLDSLLRGDFEFPYAAGYASNNSTELYFSITVTGFGYTADSTAYYLALTVLFTYALLALLHTVYSLWTRTACDAWESLSDLLVVSQNSPPALQVLKNTSAGIRDHATLRTAVRVRVVSAAGRQKFSPEQEELHLLYGPGIDVTTYEEVKIGEKYGALT